jgi:hypothetical protein
MTRLIEDPALSERLATRGAAHVRAEFGIARMLELVQSTYLRVLAQEVR